MGDDRTSAQRSETMRRVRGRDTSCEVALRKALHRLGLRYRLGYDLLGKPDLVFVRARVAVFVDGCFWHGCPEHCRLPASNRAYWKGKIERNRARDIQTAEILEHEGWRVVRVWEHKTRNNRDLESAARSIERVVRSR